MRIRLGYDIVLQFQAPTPLLMLLSVHPSRTADLLQPDRGRVKPEVPVEEFLDGFGNRCGRLVAPAGRLRLWNETLIQDSGLPDPVCLEACQHAVAFGRETGVGEVLEE